MAKHIQWYPGHMSKAMRQFKEKLSLVDIVFELRDARIPLSSTNPNIDEAIGDKKRLVILMKEDLADPQQTRGWLNAFEGQGQAILSVNAKQNKAEKDIERMARDLLEEDRSKRAEKGLKDRPIRAIVAGVPNVGKSTLINRIAGKKIASIGNRPGITKAQQWIKYGKNIELLDTPGILWPKFEDQEVGYKLALTGAISDRIFYADDVALYAIDTIEDHYPGTFQARYKLTDEEASLPGPDLLMAIAKKRGFGTDYERASEMIINEFRDGLLGRITLDRVEEIPHEK